MSTFEPGSLVLIRINPNHAAAVNILCTLVEVGPGAGDAGCDEIDVRYADPRTGEDHAMPFGDANLSQGEPRVLLEAAVRHDAMAAELRRLAGE